MNIKYHCFDKSSPFKHITAIDSSLCPRGSLLSCMIPDIARTTIPPLTQIEVVEKSIYVRGVNSCFWLIKTNNKQYYVHESLIICQ